MLVTLSAASDSKFNNETAKPANFNLNGVFQTFYFLAPSSSTTIHYFIAAVSPGTENSFALLSSSATDGTATVTATYYY